MAEQDARGALALARREGRAEGRVQVRAEGCAEGVLSAKHAARMRLLERRGLAVFETSRTRIETCVDEAPLDRWFDAALVAATTEDALR
jgi:hypothetical protein